MTTLLPTEIDTWFAEYFRAGYTEMMLYLAKWAMFEERYGA